MTPHMVTIHDYLTPDALTGLAMIAGLMLGMGALFAVMTISKK